MGAMFGDVIEHTEPVAVGQPHVGQAQVVAVRLEQRESFAGTRRAVRLEPHAAQSHAEQLSDVGLVVHHEHLVFHV